MVRIDAPVPIIEMRASDKNDRELLKGTWWFPLRRFLPGWGLPVCWQGWLVLGGYVALLLLPLPFFPRRFAAYYVAYVFALTVTLAAVMAKKGEPLR
jgi:hypothetical protein